MSKSNTVSITRYTDTYESFKKAVERADGFQKLSPNQTVLIKPNLVCTDAGSNKIPKWGMITTTRVVEHTVQMLKEYGCRHIEIGEGSLANKEIGAKTARAYRWIGIDKIAQKYDVTLRDFNQGPFQKVTLGDTTVKVASAPLEADFLIDLPVLKTHILTKVSLGIKNLKGCLEEKSRKKFHAGNLEQLLALLGAHINPDLTIIDGIYALEHGHTALGTAHLANLLVVGRNCLACDIVGTEIMGIDPLSVSHFQEYSKITGDALSLDAIDIVGESIDSVRRPFEWYRDFSDIYHEAGIKGVTVQSPKDICTGCLILAEGISLMFCKDNRGRSFDDVEICFGKGVKAKDTSKQVFLVGNCAINENRDHPTAVRVKGCYPKIMDFVPTLFFRTMSKPRAFSLLLVRTIKDIANRLKLYNEDYFYFKDYPASDFSENHFKPGC